MARTSQHEKLLTVLDDGKLGELECRVLEVLLKAPNGITRRGLVRAIYGVEAQRNLSNDPYDRKIRKAIESLRKRMIPIISSSGKAGYRMDTSPEAIQNMIRELRSRIAHLEQRLEEACQFNDLQGTCQSEENPRIALSSVPALGARDISKRRSGFGIGSVQTQSFHKRWSTPVCPGPDHRSDLGATEKVQA
jgi:hypothetical protein